MRRFNELLSDDTNQFGPGTDLTISLLAVLLVISLITSHLYRAEHDRATRLQAEMDGPGGNFRLSSEFFTAADFHPRPVTRLVDPRKTRARVARIVRDYRQSAGEYPFIFVIGHSSTLDDPDAKDRSVNGRRRRNMEYALRRAALITSLLQEELHESEVERLIAASSGEFDLKKPSSPTSQENAWVEVVFGREWKVPGHAPAR